MIPFTAATCLLYSLIMHFVIPSGSLLCLSCETCFACCVRLGMTYPSFVSLASWVICLTYHFEAYVCAGLLADGLDLI